MSQVKNLRAMFESKGDNSPPDSRGRSPTEASTTSEAPRPLSKIRTNFVAVEKDGRIGLKRDQSGDSSISRRRLSNDTDTSLYRTRSKMSTQDDTVRGPAAESIPEATEAATAEPSNGTEKKTDPSAKPNEGTPVEAAASRSTTTAKAATKPTAAKIEPAKRPVTKPVAPRAAAGTPATKRPAPVKVGANDTGFVKPKPKSPTKPVNLPSSLMAPTAASSGGKGGARRSLSGQGSLPQSASAHAIGSSAASKTVTRQLSAANRQRPSLGVPSASKLSQESSTKRQSQVDEGFLARMMRPTAASSSKTTDKGVPTTPPKKTVPRPTHLAAEGAKRTVKSPVANRAGSVARTRDTISRSDKPPTKTTRPASSKTASSVSKAAAVPTAAAAAVVAGAAIVASKVVPDSTASKLADKLQDLGIDAPKQEAKEQPAAEEKHITEPEADPEPEHTEEVTEAEPEHVVETIEAEPEVEAEAPAEPGPVEDVVPIEEPEEQSVDEVEALEEAHAEAEEEQEVGTTPEVEEAEEQEPETAPGVEEAEESEPIVEEEAQVVEDIAEEPVEEEEIVEEPIPLEEAALEAAQVETAEEAIEIAHEADPEHHAIPADITEHEDEPTAEVAEEEHTVGNGHAAKTSTVADVTTLEPISVTDKLTEAVSEHDEKAIDTEAATKVAEDAE